MYHVSLYIFGFVYCMHERKPSARAGRSGSEHSSTRAHVIRSTALRFNLSALRTPVGEFTDTDEDPVLNKD